MLDIKIIIIILIMMSILVIYKSNFISKEGFRKPKKPYLWMYWEDKVPGVKKPSYLDLCIKTVYKHCSKDFNIKLLNEKTINRYLPNLRPDLHRKLGLNQRTDYYRVMLLYKYGGVWLDVDTIVIKSLKPMMKKLKTYDYIGFGCHGEKKCIKTKWGFPNPANWVMIARKGSKLMQLTKLYQDKILDNLGTNHSKNYFELGRNVLWKAIAYLRKTDPNWKYYHYPSNCLERNSKGIKLINELSLSDLPIDPVCKDKYIFVPIYNTAPGFPQWFKDMSETEILKGKMLISKFFRLSLT